jgi:ABC-type amino acid transport substrate-binding protein
MILFRLCTVFFICTLVTTHVEAESIQQCKKVVIAGDSQWPPYTLIAANGLQGIGMEIAQQIFTELDIEVELTIYEDSTKMMQGLRNGTIDVIVSTYDHSAVDFDATILQPGYIVDQVTVAIPITASDNITSWDDLVGAKGIANNNFMPDDQVQAFFTNYLTITTKDDLLTDLHAVQAGAYNYIVGSDLQLSYAIKNNNLENDLIVMKNLTRGGEVHMAFSNNSVCQLYSVYLQKRLQDYRNNGTVEKIMRQYIY